MQRRLLSLAAVRESSMSQSVFETALPDDVAACLGMPSMKPGKYAGAAGVGCHGPLMMHNTMCYPGAGIGHELQSAVQSISDSLRHRSASGGLPATMPTTPFCSVASDVARTLSDTLDVTFAAFRSDRGYAHSKSSSTTSSLPTPISSIASSINSLSPFERLSPASLPLEASRVPPHVAPVVATATGLKPPPCTVPPAAAPGRCSPGSRFATAASVAARAAGGGLPAGFTDAAEPPDAAAAATPPPPAPSPPPTCSLAARVAAGLCIVPPNHSITLASSGPQTCPAHGIKAVCGKRSKMEDMFQVQANFFDLSTCPPILEHEGKSCPARISSRRCVPSDGGTGAAGGSGGGGSERSPSRPNSAPVSPQLHGRPFVAGSTAEYESSCSESSADTLHFFGVYDGHGGTQASEHCAKRLHHHLGQVLAETCGVFTAQAVGPTCCDKVGQLGHYCQTEWNLSPCSGSRGDKPAAEQPESVPERKAFDVPRPISAAVHSNSQPVPPRGAVRAVCAPDTVVAETGCCDAKQGIEGGHAGKARHGPMGDLDLAYDGLSEPVIDEGSCSFRSGVSSGSSSSSSGSSGLVNVNALLEDALREAFVRTDAEFAAESSAPMVGSTAVVALVGSRKLWVANCGDSRAVLCRAAKAIQLTDDHKPEREDEAERVERAGGQVLYWNGHRVMGVLAMSRAIGDHALRPYVICEPEITVMVRTEEDDFLLLASDGLWDVMSNQEATSLAIRCMRRAREKGASKKAAVRIAASVLTKAAMDRGSKDNITVVIVDLSGPGGAPPAAAAADDDDAMDDSLAASMKSVAGRSGGVDAVDALRAARQAAGL